MVVDALSRHNQGILSLDTFREKVSFSELTTSVKSEESDFKSKKVEFFGVLPTLKEIEELLIAEALNRCDQNQTIAADLLGISRRALNNRIQRNQV